MELHRKVLWLLFAVVGTSLLVSCEPGDKPPPPPPPPSPEEIREASRKVWQSAAEPQSGESTQQYFQRVVSGLQQFRSKYGATDTGRQEIMSMTNKFLDAMRRNVDQGMWEWSEMSCNFVLTLSPGNAEASRAMEKIQVELDKPKLKLTMFWHFREEDKLHVVFDVTPRTGETESVKVQVGDEFFGYKLKSIIGNNQGVRLEYMPTRSSITLMLEK